MRNFEGFMRKAVVIVPTDEEYMRRVAEREQVEGKDVPDSAVMEMKGNKTYCKGYSFLFHFTPNQL